MHTLVRYLRRRVIPTLNPFRPLGNAVQVQSRWSLSRTDKIRLAIVLYGLSLGFIYLFFKEYATVLSTKKLLTTDTMVITKSLVLPVAYFSISIYFLTLGMELARTILPIYLVPAVYILSLGVSSNTLISSSIVLLAYLIFYFQFSISLGEFKRPTLTKVLISSLSLFSLVLSVAVTISLYHGFSSRAESVGSKLGEAANNRFSFIFNTNTPAEEASLKKETLYSYSVKYLKAHNMPTTPASIKEEEQSVVTGLGLKSALTTDTMANLKNKAVGAQIAAIIKTYRKLILIAVPFAFFFITESLTSVASMIAVGMMFITERVLKIKKVRKVPSDII